MRNKFSKRRSKYTKRINKFSKRRNKFSKRRTKYTKRRNKLYGGETQQPKLTVSKHCKNHNNELDCTKDSGCFYDLRKKNCNAKNRYESWFSYDVVPSEIYTDQLIRDKHYALRKAILEENIKEVRNLITNYSYREEPDINIKAFKYHRRAAAYTGNVEIMKLLIDNGALNYARDYEDVLKIATAAAAKEEDARVAAEEEASRVTDEKEKAAAASRAAAATIAHYNYVELVKLFLTQAELKQVNLERINKFIDEIIHENNPANRAVLDLLHSHRAKKQWGKVTHIHNKDTTTKRDLRRKSCEIPYYSLLGDQEHIDTALLEKHKRLFSTKSFSPSISKYGGICDIRPQIPEETIMSKYPNFMKFVDTEEFVKFTNIRNNISGTPYSIMFPYLVDSNIVLKKAFDILNLGCRFDNSSGRFKFVRIPTFKGSIRQKFQNFSNSEGIADYDADLSVDIGNGDKKKIVFFHLYNVKEGGHGTALVIEKNVGYIFDSNNLTYDINATENIYKQLKKIFSLTDIKLISEINNKCSFLLRYQKEPASCLMWATMFLHLVFLNPDKSIQEIANYWGWKVGQKLNSDTDRYQYLNTKLKLYSAYVKELLGFDEDIRDIESIIIFYDWKNHIRDDTINDRARKINYTYTDLPWENVNGGEEFIYSYIFKLYDELFKDVKIDYLHLFQIKHPRRLIPLRQYKNAESSLIFEVIPKIELYKDESMTKIIIFDELEEWEDEKDLTIDIVDKEQYENLELIAEVDYDIDRMMQRYNIKSIKNNSE